jgi:solute carrier family 30 (zinc transporter), member 1
MQIPGVVSVHELHVWRLNQQKSLASAHVVIEASSLEQFQNQAKTINECLHAYGVHSATIQPELASQSSELLRRRTPGDTEVDGSVCQMNCGSVCEKMKCCG